MKQISLRLAPELLAAIDTARGDVPRERWVRGVLEAAVRDETPRPSPAGREAKTEVATTPARPAATSPQGASRPVLPPPAPPAHSKRELDAERQQRLNAALARGRKK